MAGAGPSLSLATATASWSSPVFRASGTMLTSMRLNTNSVSNTEMITFLVMDSVIFWPTTLIFISISSAATSSPAAPSFLLFFRRMMLVSIHFTILATRINRMSRRRRDNRAARAPIFAARLALARDSWSAPLSSPSPPDAQSIKKSISKKSDTVAARSNQKKKCMYFGMQIMEANNSPTNITRTMTDTTSTALSVPTLPTAMLRSDANSA